MTTLFLSHRENKKYELKKCIKVVSKYKKIYIASSNEELISEVHWNVFNIYIQVFKILNDVIVINFILGSPFHILKINLLHGVFDQSHV